MICNINGVFTCFFCFFFFNHIENHYISCDYSKLGWYYMHTESAAKLQ